MIPNIGLMLAVYAIARLLQVPLEASPLERRWIGLLSISIPAILIIAFLALDLVLSSSNVKLPPGLQ